MREIKFRAWDVSLKVMFPVSAGGASKLESENFELFIPNCILMQFTGLLDKNGKEIYEGDIVRNQAYAIRDVRQTKYGEYKLFCGKHSDSFDKGWVEGTEWKVIGNIYENPELLIQQEGR